MSGDSTDASIAVLEDRWVEFRGVEGWEEFVIRIQSRLFRGEAQATGLAVEHVDPDQRVGLTSQRLRRLPVLELAREALLYLPRESNEVTLSPPAHEMLAELSLPQKADVMIEIAIARGPNHPWLADLQPELRKALLTVIAQSRRPTRATVPLDKFVDSWRAAFNDPARPSGVRDAVCADLKISTRTYDRYRKQAEADGLMPQREERRP